MRGGSRCCCHSGLLTLLDVSLVNKICLFISSILHSMFGSYRIIQCFLNTSLLVDFVPNLLLLLISSFHWKSCSASHDDSGTILR